MKVFVTGSASFIGRELIQQCLANDISVIGVDVVDSGEENCYIADIRDPKIIDLIPEDVDALIHLAALSRDSDCCNRGYDSFDINVMGTLNLIEAAQIKKVKQFIFASTEWVYTELEDSQEKTEESYIDIRMLTSEYALSKLVSEVNLRQKFDHGLCPVTILRLGIIYGPRADNWSAVEALLNGVASSEEVAVGSLETSRRFIHVADVARAFRLSIGLDGFNIINIQGAKLISLGDVIDISKSLLGRTTKIYEKDPANSSIRSISNRRAKELIGFESNIDLEQGVISVKAFLDL